MITVTGGVYAEQCIEPPWDDIFGSGGRAAAALKGHCPARLVTYVSSGLEVGHENLRRGFQVDLSGPKTQSAVAFSYMHSLAVPFIRPRPDAIKQNASLEIADDIVLRFGMLEGDAVVTAKRAIYDPQSAFSPVNFTANGSSADELALILNQFEAKLLSGQATIDNSLEELRRTQNASVIIIKMGSHGALVATDEGTTVVPAYASDRVFKIGSGDVFSAAFALFWGVEKRHPAEAADLASRSVAHYVETQSLPIPDAETLMAQARRAIRPGKGQIYIASPFFDIGQRWLVEEIFKLFQDAGIQTFSPLHHVGVGPASYVAPRDIEGLEQSDVVLAILNGADVGTVFEVGYAVARQKPVICLAQNMRVEDLKMVEGSNCTIVEDLVTAIYKAIWALP